MAKEFEGHYQWWESDMYAVDCLCGKMEKDGYGIERHHHVVIRADGGDVCEYCGRRYWVEGYQQGTIMVEERSEE